MDKEFLEQVVFSTNYVLREKSPIIDVFHDIDGTWQFFGPEKNITTDNGVILLMKEILEIDPTLIQAIDIPKGHVARRVSIGSKWIIEKHD